MGAPTSNRKRGDYCYTVNCKPQSLYSSTLDNPFDDHVSKKPKISPSMHLNSERPGSAKSTASRIYRYPEPLNRFRREIHAPCRVPKFGFCASLSRESRAIRTGFGKEGLADIMGNVFCSPYDWAKNRTFEALEYLRKGKGVVDFEADEQTVEDGLTEDSSIEEIEILEDHRPGRLVVSDKVTSGAVSALLESDRKAVEPSCQPSSSSLVSDLTNANLKVNNASVMLDSLSLDWDVDVLGLPAHKRLLEAAQRRNPKLDSLSFKIKLLEKLRDAFQLRHPIRKPVVEDVCQDVHHEPFVPLTEEEDAEVSKAFSKSNRRKALVTHENSNIEITGEVLQCLRPQAWLNDEVINVYLELLKERERREPDKFLKCHFFNTFFYKKLIGGRNGYDFKSVRRWTTQRKLGYYLLECDKIFVPIHKEVHWCLAVINKKDQKFQYLDSLGGVDAQVLKVLARYFVDEVKDKGGEDIDISSWEQEYVEDLPEQENGWDCGMFMIKYADFYSRGLGLCFNQQHMTYFRLRTAKEILRLKAE